MSEQSIAHYVLSAWDAEVEAIPTSEKNESDWLATLAGFRLLVEEKTKLENPGKVADRNDALKSGKAHGGTTPLRPSNRISGVFRKAAKQLASTGASLEHDARVVWLTSVGFDGEAKDYQAFNTLYGATKVFDLDVSASLRDCFFFHNGDFFHYRELDGAYLVVAEGGTATVRLCLNPFSDRWQALRDSPFAKKLSTVLVDPIAQEAAGEAMFADTDVDRRNSGAVLDYLRQKYGVSKLFNMEMNMASVVVAVPHER